MTETAPPTSPWMTRAEAAAYLRVSIPTFDRIVRELSDDGRDIRRYSPGMGAPRFNRNDLDELPARRRRPA